MFIHFDGMFEHDRHTHTPHDSIGHTCIASRSKNGKMHILQRAITRKTRTFGVLAGPA